MQVHDQDFLVLKAVLGGPQRIIDAGANKGQSIETLAVLFPLSVIDSFEPNPIFYPQLEKIASTLSGVKIHHCGLGSAAGTFKFYIPIVDGIRYLEETSVFLAEFQKPWVADRLAARGRDIQFEEFLARVQVGDDLELSPTLIKVDVEGAESSVLRGLERTIRRHKPVIIAENSDWHDVTNFLGEIGYSGFMPDSENEKLIPFSGERVNTIYVWDGQA